MLTRPDDQTTPRNLPRTSTDTKDDMASTPELPAVTPDIPAQWTGHIIQRRPDGTILRDQDNLVVDAAAEVMAQAILGTEVISGIQYGFTNGLPVTRGMRTLPNPVAYAATGTTTATRPFISRDRDGLRSIITWGAVLTPPQDIVYDTMGLATSSGLLFAATAFEAVELAEGETIETIWSIMLRGIGA